MTRFFGGCCAIKRDPTLRIACADAQTFPLLWFYCRRLPVCGGAAVGHRSSACKPRDGQFCIASLPGNGVNSCSEESFIAGAGCLCWLVCRLGKPVVELISVLSFLLDCREIMDANHTGLAAHNETFDSAAQEYFT